MLPRELHGRRLALARAVWLVAASSTLAVSLAGFIVAVQQPEFAGTRLVLGAWAQVGVTLLLPVLGLLLPVLLTYSATGLFLFWRRSSDPTALLVSLTFIMLGGTLSQFVFTVERAFPSLPGPGLVANVAFGLIVVVLFVFPNGRFRPTWVGAPVLVAVALLVWLDVGAVVRDVPDLPPEFPPWRVAITVALGLGLCSAGVLAQAYRYRRVSGYAERQQTKWVVASLAGSIVWLIVGLLLPSLLWDPAEWFGWLIVASTLPVFLVPISVAVAVLRYRLYDIDLIINRTLVYGLVTLLLAGAFVVLTSLVQSVVPSTTGPGVALVPGATGFVMALCFQPVRRWARTVVDRVLPAREERALFFTDIVGSTELLAEVGDAGWRQLLDKYRAAVRRELKRFGGTEMHIAGDSFFVTFTDPVRAVRCALMLAPALRALGLPSRFGIHWGICEMRGPEVSGLAVWAAARVMSAAGGGEILVSEALRETITDPALELEDQGIYHLKGLPDEWRLYAVVGAAGRLVS
jgi:class 3 adenylate cyclase